MSCIYKISVKGKSKTGSVAHFNAEVKVNKHFDFHGDSEQVKSALKPLIARQNPGLYQKWNVTPSSVQIESYHYNYIDGKNENDKNSKSTYSVKKSSILDKMGVIGTILKIILWPFRILFKIAEFVLK